MTWPEKPAGKTNVEAKERRQKVVQQSVDALLAAIADLEEARGLLSNNVAVFAGDRESRHDAREKLSAAARRLRRVREELLGLYL